MRILSTKKKAWDPRERRSMDDWKRHETLDARNANKCQRERTKKTVKTGAVESTREKEGLSMLQLVHQKKNQSIKREGEEVDQTVVLEKEKSGVSAPG